jgi:hypothetical protein
VSEVGSAAGSGEDESVFGPRLVLEPRLRYAYPPLRLKQQLLTSGD